MVKDVKNGRDRWLNRFVFILAAAGSCIGLGNIWKFPYLTFKHGGVNFMVAYLIALFAIGIPMLILELTLGQKMQRGSAGALRGITPRLAGSGWAASFSGFVTAIVYNILLGLVLVYLFANGSQPWKDDKYERPLACTTAAKSEIPNTELYLYMNVTALLSEHTCERFSYGNDTGRFAGGLFAAVIVCWVIIFLCIIKGVKSSSYVVMITASLPFIFLIILMSKFVGFNGEMEGKGIDFYFGSEDFPLPPNPTTGEILNYDPSANSDSLVQDALLQVFFSVGVCYGVMYAYGSYNPVKKPVILDSLIIAFLDFFFSILAGFIIWGGIGALKELERPEYTQTNSVGLTFIAFPALAASMEDAKPWFGVFCFFMFISGIDSAFSYIEGFVTNLVDGFKWNRQFAAAFVCLLGMAISAVFTTNFGWVLFDLVDHYISSYIVIGVGLMQCISVGWLFEKETTAAVSQGHSDSVKWLGLIYWTTVVTMCFYANFGFKDSKEWGVIVILIGSLVALGVSYKVSKLKFRSWYHEIVLCGVDKLSMSITSLSNPDGSRSLWMAPFEAYFGVCIKFISPACLLWLLCENLEADLADPYAEQPEMMQVYSSLIVFVTVALIFGPMFVCDYPELFEHNVDEEFNADNLYALKLRGGTQTAVKALKQTQPATSKEVEMIPPPAGASGNQGK